MIAKKWNMPILAQAGPGAGKTHAMVDEIVGAIQALPPHRFLAAVTYTNAAANTIRERLAKRVSIRHNIFVGTTHSFVNRFILAPCARLFSLFPEDCVYAPVDVHEKGRGASIYTGNLINKGIIPYDAMIPKARTILNGSSVRNRICGRLAYIFVDEFQDVDIGMLEILDHFRKAGKTNLYVVGDPEQYVMSFTYRGQKSPTHDKIPFCRFKKSAQIVSIVENHRSNCEIVEFVNQFREDLKQKAIKPRRIEPRVLFIPATDLDKIVACFQSVSANVEIHNEQRTRLYLSEENATFDQVRDQFQLAPISNVGRKTNTLLGDTLELFSIALDRSQKRACEEFGLSRLQWRAVGIQLLKQLRGGHYSIDDFKVFMADKFGFKVPQRSIGEIEKDLQLLRSELIRGTCGQMNEMCSSIRKAKGLQADAVLVVAKSISELKKWLQTDRACRLADKQDKCRLGYVAFTRPREMLCIASLKKPDTELLNLLKNLGIVTISGDGS